VSPWSCAADHLTSPLGRGKDAEASSERIVHATKTNSSAARITTESGIWPLARIRCRSRRSIDAFRRPRVAAPSIGVRLGRPYGGDRPEQIFSDDLVDLLTCIRYGYSLQAWRKRKLTHR
jgi:hypothetical protein